MFLAMGGIALGKGVMVSGLLEVLDGAIRKAVDGMGLYTVVMALSAVVLVSGSASCLSYFALLCSQDRVECLLLISLPFA